MPPFLRLLFLRPEPRAARTRAQAIYATLRAGLVAIICVGCGSWSRRSQPPTHNSQVNLANAATARLLPAPAAVRVFCPTWDPTAASSGDATTGNWIECHAVRVLGPSAEPSAAALLWLAAKASLIDQSPVGTVNGAPVLLGSATVGRLRPDGRIDPLIPQCHDKIVERALRDHSTVVLTNRLTAAECQLVVPPFSGPGVDDQLRAALPAPQPRQLRALPTMR